MCTEYVLTRSKFGSAGTLLGGYTNGKLMDRNDQARAREAGLTIDKVSHIHAHGFNKYSMLCLSTSSLQVKGRMGAHLPRREANQRVVM